MSATLTLGGRSLREMMRQPDALLMTFFIPIFFLIVNTGQAADIFPSASTDSSRARATAPSSCRSRCCSRRRSGWPRCFSKTRSAAATNSGGLIFLPLLFLTPNFVPRDMLTEPMEVAAALNPVTYLMEAMRSLILDDLDRGAILPGFGVVAALGVVMLMLNVRMIKRYDRRHQWPISRRPARPARRPSAPSRPQSARARRRRAAARAPRAPPTTSRTRPG